MFGVSKIYKNDINIFIQQGCINLIKSDSKYIYNVTKDYIQINAVFELYIQQNVQKRMYHGFHKNVNNITVLSIDNNRKCFLSIKSAY